MLLYNRKPINKFVAFNIYINKHKYSKLNTENPVDNITLKSIIFDNLIKLSKSNNLEDILKLDEDLRNIYKDNLEKQDYFVNFYLMSELAQI